MKTNHHQLSIDPGFSDHLRPLSGEETGQLRASLEKSGCLDPIFVWAESPETIVDGHHRYAICCELDIPFKVKAISFQDRAAVLGFIETQQVGRRNLTPTQLKYYRGKEYLREKQRHGGQVPKKGSAQNEHSLKTEQRLADKFSVSSATVRRDADFAAEVDASAPEERTAILNGKRKLKRKVYIKSKKTVDAPVKDSKGSLSPVEKIDLIDAQLGAIKEARSAIRKILDTKLLSIPPDRLGETLKQAKAVRQALNADVKTLENAYKQARQKSTRKTPKKPNQKKKSTPRAASGNQQPVLVPTP